MGGSPARFRCHLRDYSGKRQHRCHRTGLAGHTHRAASNTEWNDRADGQENRIEGMPAHRSERRQGEVDSSILRHGDLHAAARGQILTFAARLVVGVAALCMIAPVRAAGPSYVDITWMSISNIYYELGA